MPEKRGQITCRGTGTNYMSHPDFCGRVLEERQRWGGREEQKGSAAAGKRLAPSMRSEEAKTEALCPQGGRRGAGRRGDGQAKVLVWRHEGKRSPWLSGEAIQPSVSPEELIPPPVRWPTLGLNRKAS